MCKHINDIKENYKKLEKELVTQLNYQVGNHPPTAGSNREKIWEHFFRRIVPKKFNIERSVFIIDSKEHASREVDIAIYDEQYTPYIFNYGDIKFIPVEAVAAVIQCKSKELDKKSLKDWVKSIDDLKTSPNSIVRLATYIHMPSKKNDQKFKPMQTATKPIKILCYMSDNETSTKHTRGRGLFDIVIEAYQNSKEEKRSSRNNDRNLKITFTDKNLYEILYKYNQADRYHKKNKPESCDDNKELEKTKINDYRINEYSLLSFIFQFNQMLMLINNPMFFPHKAYVDMFNGKKESEEE